MLDLMSIPKCYICGQPLAVQRSGDHVVPKTLIVRSQPRVKGFDYAGKLPTHPKCNNEFGAESRATKALDLIAALHNDECWHEYRHQSDPTVRMMAINSECLPQFTQRDLRYFKMIDARSKSKSELGDLSLLKNQKPINPRRDALYTALAVLTKSAAALIVSRKLLMVPAVWDVLAIPYVGKADALDLDTLFGKTEPFDTGIKVWLARLETEDYLAVYKAKSIVVYFLFRFSESDAATSKLSKIFPNATRLHFQGNSLKDLLLSHAWKEV